MSRKTSLAKVVGEAFFTCLVALGILRWIEERLPTYHLPTFLENWLRWTSYMDLLLVAIFFTLLFFIFLVLELAEP